MLAKPPTGPGRARASLAALLALTLATCGAPAGGRPPVSSVDAPTLVATTTLPTPSTAPPTSTQPPATTPPTASVGTPPPIPTANLTQTIIADRSGPWVTPPASTLAYDGQTQTGRINSYTWTSPTGQMLHADIPGLLVPDDTLTLPAGKTATFHFGGTNPPATVTASPHPLTDQPPCLRQRPTLRCIPWEPPTSALPLQLSGYQAEITIALPPGEYLIVVEVTVNRSPTSREGGQAPYSFRVVVQE